MTSLQPTGWQSVTFDTLHTNVIKSVHTTDMAQTRVTHRHDFSTLNRHYQDWAANILKKCTLPYCFNCHQLAWKLWSCISISLYLPGVWKFSLKIEMLTRSEVWWRKNCNKNQNKKWRIRVHLSGRKWDSTLETRSDPHELRVVTAACVWWCKTPDMTSV